MTLDDWRKKTSHPEVINHSSLFSDGKTKLFSKANKPRLRTGSAPGRVQIFSNYCKHCGGRT